MRHPGLTSRRRRAFTTLELPLDELRAARMRRRKAFTTLELLIVIGIILLLMAISVLGFRHFDKVASGKQTVAQLNLCKNLLIEYERGNGLKYLEGPPPTPGDLPAMYVDQANMPSFISLNDLMAGTGDVSARSGAGARYAAAAISRMFQDQPPSNWPAAGLPASAIVRTLARIPANRTALSAIPANRLLEAPLGKVAVFDPTNFQQQVAAGVVLDGWGNPIIFVPRGGMVVNIKDPSTGQSTQFLVRTSGIKPFTGQAPPLIATDRPFFASAGQDADFTQGEDNVYSFQQE